MNPRKEYRSWMAAMKMPGHPYYIVYEGDKIRYMDNSMERAKKQARHLRDTEGRKGIRIVKDSVGGVG